MKNAIRAAIFVGILSSMLACYSSAAFAADVDCKTKPVHVKKHAHAKHKKTVAHNRNKGFNLKIRGAQMRLSDLGYFVGWYDGVVGPKTRAAIKSFQHIHGLKADGRLNDKTYQAICMTQYMAHHYYLASYNGAGGYTGYPYNRPGHVSGQTGAWVVRGSDR